MIFLILRRFIVNGGYIMDDFPVRIRRYASANYAALFADGKTVRFFIDSNKPLMRPPFPELLDVAINNLCFAGCFYCYISAENSGHNYKSIVHKALKFFGGMSEHDRPFQIAIGGAGEPTLHPDFPTFVRVVHDLGIVPNFTTNGMHLKRRVLDSERWIGGVAVSAHPHLDKIWRRAVGTYLNYGFLTNIHVIVGYPGSVDLVADVFECYGDVVDHILLLPLVRLGRGSAYNVFDEEYDRVIDFVLNSGAVEKFAYGAHFYDYLRKKGNPVKASLYEPEMFSGYLDFDKMEYFSSSFVAAEVL